MRFGSLFSGIGGMDLGLERAGMECVWQVEIDDYASKVLAKHWPTVERFRDVRDVGKHNLAPVDLICGGFPCQDISNAGKRAGIDGERSGLWSEFYRIICEIRPQLVLVENVAALLERGIERVLGDLAKSGYDAEWDCIPAAAVGAPHRRDRVFLVAYIASEQSYRIFKQGIRRDDRATAQTGINAYDGTQRVQGSRTESLQRFPAFSWCKDVRRAEELRGRSDIPEPLFRGASDGIPHWMDRLKGLGNAVVPQVAEWIGRRILAATE